jgi:hypothetical protein
MGGLRSLHSRPTVKNTATPSHSHGNLSKQINSKFEHFVGRWITINCLFGMLM